MLYSKNLKKIKFTANGEPTELLMDESNVSFFDPQTILNLPLVCNEEDNFGRKTTKFVLKVKVEGKDGIEIMDINPISLVKSLKYCNSAITSCGNRFNGITDCGTDTYVFSYFEVIPTYTKSGKVMRFENSYDVLNTVKDGHITHSALEEVIKEHKILETESFIYVPKYIKLEDIK